MKTILLTITIALILELGQAAITVPPDDILTEIRDNLLEEHNKKRALHKDTNPLVRDAELDKSAQAWAVKMAEMNKMEHDHSAQGAGRGENIGWAGPASTTKDALLGFVQGQMEGWYDKEETMHTYGVPDADFNDVGHFTQIVWRDTKKVGFGIASSADKTFVSAQFSPPGNYGGKFGEMVESKNVANIALVAKVIVMIAAFC